jgi:hypothetical protein
VFLRCSRAKYGRYQIKDFFHRVVKLECETRQVHALEVALLVLKNGPRGIVDQVYFMALIVSVTQAAHAAEKIAQVY